MTEVPQKNLTLHLRSQSLQKVNLDFNEWRPRILEETLPCLQIAILICDMWDTHWSRGAAERVNQMAPRMNAVLKVTRDLGVTILHAPSETMSFYAGSPARQRALKVPAISAPVEIEHQDYALPVDDSHVQFADLSRRLRAPRQV